jgi:hypothetical protein
MGWPRSRVLLWVGTALSALDEHQTARIISDKRQLKWNNFEQVFEGKSDKYRESYEDF